MTLQLFSPYSFENFSIKEIGGEINPKEKLWIKQKLSQLEQRAPATSRIVLSFSRTESKKKPLNAKLTISAGQLNFTSELSGFNPIAMYKSIEENIDNQLQVWKKNRFPKSYPRPEKRKFLSHFAQGRF